MRKFSRLSAIDGVRWPDEVVAVLDLAEDVGRRAVAAANTVFDMRISGTSEASVAL